MNYFTKLKHRLPILKSTVPNWVLPGLIFLVLIISNIIYRSFDSLQFGVPTVGENINNPSVVSPVTLAQPDASPTNNSTQPSSKPTTKTNTNTNTNSGTSSSNSSSSTSNSDTGGSTDPTEQPQSVSAFVAFYADSQSDTDGEDINHQRVVDYILATGANPIFHAGDLLEDGTVASRDRFNNVTATLRATRSFYAAQGNNERNSSVFFDNFTFPGNEHWYSVVTGNLKMIILDNYASSVAIGSEQYNWLSNELSNTSDSMMTGVIFHYPPYGVGGDTKGMISTVVPLFRDLGVDFVVSGHEHSYQHTTVNDIHYFVMSGQPNIGYMKATVYQSYAVLRAYNSSNSQIGSYTINNR